jgi:cysteine desulfurase / selenocysteine lyase
VGNIARHALDLGDRLIAHLESLDIRLLGPREPDQRSHILVLDLPAAAWLDYFAGRGVRVSQQRGGIRVSFAMFNTAAEVDQLAQIIRAGPR